MPIRSSGATLPLMSTSAKYLFYTGMALSLFVGTACNNGPKQKGRQGAAAKPSPVMGVEVYVVAPVTLQAEYQSSGTLLPNEEVGIYPEMSGRITEIHFKEGTKVRKGDLLVQLYDKDLKAQIEKLEVQRRLQVLTKDRQEQLLAISGISKQEYDNTVAQLASIDADLAYSHAQLSKYRIRAPFDGMVGLRQVSIGAFVNNTTLITNLQQVEPLKLDFPLPERYKNALKKGTSVRFTVSGQLDTFKAQIMAVQPSADVSTRTVTVRAMVPNAHQALTAGSYANVLMGMSSDVQGIAIPTQCIIPTSRDKKVAVIRDGKADMVTVTTGMRRASDVEILSGLQIGDTVLATGMMQVRQDMPVRATKVLGADAPMASNEGQ